MLELIDKGAAGESHPSPLLFVHGAWHAAWCWDEHFLDFFADRGYRALAVSLRGHGKSPAPKSLRGCSIADYVDDVASVAERLPVPPIVIGHSMGGFIAQKYLESHAAPAGVLLASLPPQGVAGFLWRGAKRHPLRTLRAVVTTKTLHGYSTPERAREHFYSSATPESDVARYAAMLDEEYTGRITLDTMRLNLPEPQRVTVPLLVMGAASDSCLTTDEIHATAHAYRTTAEVFPGMGHNMMLEPGWAKVAERIDDWLSAQGL